MERSPSRCRARAPRSSRTASNRSRQRCQASSPVPRRSSNGVRSAEKASLALFARGTEELEKLGILLCDTKFEFGLLDGKLLLIDEVLTPDSSRFWNKADWKVGISPPSYDKQILRDWLEAQPWDKNPPPPRLDPKVMARVGERYLEICEKLTGGLPHGVAV